MSDTACEMFEKLVGLMMEHDLESMLEMFDDDAVLTDPHYPIERMEGKEAIKRGLTWGLDTIAKPGFKIRRSFEHDNAGVAEVDTHHVLKVGVEVEFDQVFVFEACDGKFTSLRAFVPYRDPGIGGWITRVTGAWWRLRGYG